MPGYTIKNLQDDVEDSAQGFGLSPDLEARFAGDDLELETSGLGFERLAPGFRLPFGHAHPTQEEVYIVIEGSGRIKIEDEIHDLKQFDAVRLGKGVMRCTEAGPDGMAYIAFGAPPIEGDAREEVDMVQGWWSD